MGSLAHRRDIELAVQPVAVFSLAFLVATSSVRSIEMCPTSRPRVPTPNHMFHVSHPQTMGPSAVRSLGDGVEGDTFRSSLCPAWGLRASGPGVSSRGKEPPSHVNIFIK